MSIAALEDRSPANHDLSMFADLAKAASHSEEEHTQRKGDLESGIGDTWIALLLPLLSSLHSLRLACSKKSLYINRTLQRAIFGKKPFDAQPAFPFLQEASLSHLNENSDVKSHYLPSHILPFFKFPSMRATSADSVIECQPTEDETDGTTTADPLKGFSSINEIKLTSSNGRKGMESLITLCFFLRSFKYQQSGSHASAEGHQPSAFYQSLTSSKNTLETLWLDYHGQHHTFTAAGLNESHDEWFGSLTDFKTLKDIRI